MNRMQYTCQSGSVEKTAEIARLFARFLCPGDVISLNGDLGTGKTAFTKGLAAGLGIDDMISSPTFMLVMEHENKHGLNLFHFDVYRLSSGDEFFDAGLDEYFDKNGICVIEWGNIVADALPDDVIEVELIWISELERVLKFSFPESKSELFKNCQSINGGNYDDSGL